MDIDEAKEAIGFLQSQIDGCNRMIDSIRTSVDREVESHYVYNQSEKVDGWKLSRGDRYYTDVDDLLHNVKEPAVECGDTKAWYWHGKLQHKYSPALIHFDGFGKVLSWEWWYNGKRFKTRAEMRTYLKEHS